MTKINEKRIVPVINPTENQKSVLAKIKAAATPKTAAQDISEDPNLAAARDMLVRMGMITLDTEGAVITEEGEQLMVDQGLVDESGELTEDGQKAAYGEEQPPMEGYSFIKVLREDARREHYQHVPSDLLDKLTPEEEDQLYTVLDGKSDFHKHPSMWRKVYHFFVQDMPYGTAKGRDEDPFDWVLNRLLDGAELGSHSEDRYDR